MTELTDRMRTCAAHLLSTNDVDGFDRAARDAIDLLIEASNVLASYEVVIIPPVTRQEVQLDPTPPPPPRPMGRTVEPTTVELEGGLTASPPRPRTCPRCDSRAVKRVDRQGNRLMLTCPACSHEWPYVPDGKWS
jgi:hypothetical protein